MAPRARGPVLLAVAVCAVVTAVLGAHYADTYAPGRIDRALDLRIKSRLTAHHHLLDHLVTLGSPGTVVTLVLFLTLISALRRRWRAALLSLLGPAVAVALTEIVLKPVVGRHIGHAFSFPSGHTTSAFAIAVTAAVLLFDGRGVRDPLRILLIVLSLGLAAGVAAAVVGLGYHYTTDAIGGFCVALGSVLGVAIVIDVVAERRAQLPAISRKRA
ncbi:MAG: phosphatase PAP2 family protein [Actinomycetes bacterium]